MSAWQRTIAATWGRPAVYTPAVILNGSEWRNWRELSLSSRLADESSKLMLKIILNSAGQFRVEVNGQKLGAKYVVHLARLGLGISSKITDGENSGKFLKHNFVVLDWRSQTLDSGSTTSPLKLDKNTSKSARYAAVAWIEEVRRHVALQVAGAYL